MAAGCADGNDRDRVIHGHRRRRLFLADRHADPDRFGLWLGFHPCSQDEYLAMIRGYCAAYGVEIDEETLWAEAIEWQATRGSRSGRVAWQYFTDLAGRRGVQL